MFLLILYQYINKPKYNHILRIIQIHMNVPTYIFIIYLQFTV